MYIKKASLQNIRSISHFEMTFEQPAGWHVLIGDNGAGKSSVVRAFALALVGPKEALGLRSAWQEWLKNDKKEGTIKLEIEPSKEDKLTGSGRRGGLKIISNELVFKRINDNNVEFSEKNSSKQDSSKYNWGTGSGWFSVAYGPFRRFAGGNPDWNKVFYSQPKLGAHLSVFGEDVALTEAIDWLVKLNYLVLEQKEEGKILEYIKKLVNTADFLPHKAQLLNISSDGVVFKDGNGSKLPVNQLSDGFRSILSLTFELIRQLVRVYGNEDVFKEIAKDNMIIPLPGVVIIDEIDAHLHPSWQTRIGSWFTKYFPNIQFIVTTHSPLVCRACNKGSIWRLTAPGSDEKSQEITGIEKERLIYGNILDAYGTELFGQSPIISKDSDAKLKRLGRLDILAAFGNISKEEEAERIHLQHIFQTDV